MNYKQQYLKSIYIAIELLCIIFTQSLFAEPNEDLLIATQERNLVKVKKAIDQGADVNFKTAETSVLREAVSKSNNLEVVKLLIEKGADVNFHTYQTSVLMEAVSIENNLEVLKLLVDKGADVNFKTNFTSVFIKNPSIEDILGFSIEVPSRLDNNDIEELFIENSVHYNQEGKGLYSFELMGNDSLSNNYKVVNLLRHKGADVEFQTKKTSVLMQVVSEKNNLEVVKLLIEKGADIYAKDSKGRNVLFISVLNNNIEVVKLLIEKGADINAIDYNGQKNEYYYNLKNNNFEILKLFIQKKGNVNAILLDAVGNIDNLGIVKYLIDKGADVNYLRQNAWGREATVLMEAVSVSNNLGIVKYLIDKGADLNSKDSSGKTVLFYEVQFNIEEKLDDIKYLIEKGANVNAIDSSGYSVIMNIESHNFSLEIFEYLISKGADVKYKSKKGVTVLMAFINKKKFLRDRVNIVPSYNLKCVLIPEEKYLYEATLSATKLLIDKGLDINAKDFEGKTALMYADNENSIEKVEALYELGANLNAQDNLGKSVLMHLIKDIEIVKYLINAGADILAKDKENRTALYWAKENNHKDVIDYLISKGAKE